MNDYGAYFQDWETVAAPKKRRRPPPVCTDSAGNELPRASFASLQRVLDSPGNVTSESCHDCAVVNCTELGISLVRDGRTIQKAKFSLDTQHPVLHEEFVGAEGRDAAIHRFLALLKARKSYTYPE